MKTKDRLFNLVRPPHGRLQSACLRLILPCLIFGGAPFLRAGFWENFSSHDVDVITVTDMTDAGRVYPTAAPDKPIYYMIYDLGECNFGRTWGGEKTPKPSQARQWMMTAMTQQGYRLADDQHPPTQFFVFGWGMLAGGSERPALKFIGGDKVGLMWEQEQRGGFVDARALFRAMQRRGIAGKVWDIAESDLYLGIVRSYSMESIKAEKPVLLWETRFGCPSMGLWMKEAMPMMIKAAAVNLGRETTTPVNLNASDEFGGRVDFGALKVIGTEPGTGTKPQSDKPAPPPTDAQ